MIPPIGELKPAEIAAATPHPISVSFVKSLVNFLFIKFPIVPPRCTSGPYCPTEAPPLAETKAEKVDENPVFASSSCDGLWALSMTSAGPWYLEIFKVFFTRIIKNAQIIKNINGWTLKHNPPKSKIQELYSFLQEETFFTPETNATDNTETIPPTITPIITTCITVIKALFVKNFPI